MKDPQLLGRVEIGDKAACCGYFLHKIDLIICSLCAVGRSTHTHTYTNMAPALGKQPPRLPLSLYPASSFPLSPSADAEHLWQISLDRRHSWCIADDRRGPDGLWASPRKDHTIWENPSSRGLTSLKSHMDLHPAGRDHSWDYLSPWLHKVFPVLLQILQEPEMLGG